MPEVRLAKAWVQVWQLLEELEDVLEVRSPNRGARVPIIEHIRIKGQHRPTSAHVHGISQKPSGGFSRWKLCEPVSGLKSCDSFSTLPRGSKYSYMTYFGLKVPPIWVLWGLSISYMGTWTLWAIYPSRLSVPRSHHDACGASNPYDPQRKLYNP